MGEGFRGGRIVRLDEVESTMDEARRLPPDPLPLVVVARSQRRGRGRFDRTWISPPEGGLYLTVRIPWERPLAQAPLVSLGTAMGLARLAQALGCPDIALKWPNDLLLGGRKAAGILAEMHHPEQGPSQLLVGVGINVSIPARELDRAGQPATSLSRACGQDLDLDDVLLRFLEHWEEVDRILELRGFPDLVEEYRSRSDLAGRIFQLAGGGGATEIVRVEGIRDDGSLEVQVLPDGPRRIAHGGELVAVGAPAR